MTTTTGTLTFALSRMARPAGQPNRFDDIRLALVDGLVEASGTGTLDGGTWLHRWRVAVTEVADRVMATATTEVTAAAARSRFPGDRLEKVRPDAASRVELLNRLLAEGIPLEELEEVPAQDQRRGAALDEAWHRMIAVARREQGRWSRVAADIDAWRRPWRPLVIGSLLLLAATILLAAMLGGIVAPPEWFQPVNDWFWRLPWPW